MNDTEIRFHCVDVAGGDLHRAKQIYAWVTNSEEPMSGPQIIPSEYAAALANVNRKVGGFTPVSA